MITAEEYFKEREHDTNYRPFQGWTLGMYKLMIMFAGDYANRRELELRRMYYFQDKEGRVDTK